MYLARDCCGAWAWAFLGIVAMGFLASIHWILFFFFGVYYDHFSCLSFTFLLSFFFGFFCTILDYFFWDVVLLGEHSAVVVVIQVVCNKTL